MSALFLATDGERKRPYETPSGANPEAGQPDPEPFQMSAIPSCPLQLTDDPAMWRVWLRDQSDASLIEARQRLALHNANVITDYIKDCIARILWLIDAEYVRRFPGVATERDTFRHQLHGSTQSQIIEHLTT